MNHSSLPGDIRASARSPPQGPDQCKRHPWRTRGGTDDKKNQHGPGSRSSGCAFVRKEHRDQGAEQKAECADRTPPLIRRVEAEDERLHHCLIIAQQARLRLRQHWRPRSADIPTAMKRSRPNLSHHGSDALISQKIIRALSTVRKMLSGEEKRFSRTHS